LMNETDDLNVNQKFESFRIGATQRVRAF